MGLVQILGVVIAALVVLYIGYCGINKLANTLLEEEAISKSKARFIKVAGNAALVVFCAALIWSTGVLPKVETRGGNYQQEYQSQPTGEATKPEIDQPDTGADVDAAKDQNQQNLDEFENK